MKDRIRAATVQFTPVAGDVEVNLTTVKRLTEDAVGDGAQIIVFPECCLTSYWFLRRLNREALGAIAEPVPDGPPTDALLGLAQKHNTVVGAGLVESEGNRFFNTYVVAQPDGSVHRHRKLHVFVSEHIDSGDEFTVFDSPLGCQIGVLICYDNNIAENARINALMGVDILLAPHQTGGCRSRSPHAMKLIDPALWERRSEDPPAIEAEFRGSSGKEWLMRWLPARAHDNGFFLIFSNGVGPDDDEIRTGNAMILDPYGRILAETWAAEDRTVIADLDFRCSPNRPDNGGSKLGDRSFTDRLQKLPAMNSQRVR